MASVSDMQQLRQEFDSHVVRDTKWKLEQDQRWERNNALQDQTMNIQRECAVQLKALSEDTAGIIKLYQGAESVIWAGTGLQKFMIWLVKWGAIGAGLVAGINYLVDFFNRPPMV